MKKNPEDISIGLVSVSDRAYEGSYPDLGIPALETWLASAIKSRIWLEKRLIPDEYEQVEKTLHELVDEDRCSLILTTWQSAQGKCRDLASRCVKSACISFLQLFCLVRSPLFVNDPSMHP